MQDMDYFCRFKCIHNNEKFIEAQVKLEGNCRECGEEIYLIGYDTIEIDLCELCQVKEFIRVAVNK